MKAFHSKSLRILLALVGLYCATGGSFSCKSSSGNSVEDRDRD